MEKLVRVIEEEGYSISYGVEIQKDDFNLDQLVKDADAKMVRCKREHYISLSREKR